MIKHTAQDISVYLEESFLNTSDGHKVWYGIAGNPNGTPVVSLHGGPGSQSKVEYLDNLDLKSMKVIQIDQRGCGKSTPTGELKHNSTTKLLEDIEKIRVELKINRWVVSGGSWGSTLALLYAEKYPTRVMALSLSSIFLGRSQDITWLFSSNGAGRIFPDEWALFSHVLNDSGVAGKDWMQKSLDLITLKPGKHTKELVAAIRDYEHSLDGGVFTRKLPEEVEEHEIANTTVFLYYMLNNLFIEDNQILQDISKIKQTPTRIIHGRYDIVCPLTQAHLLDSNLDKSELVISPYSGHSIAPESKRLLKLMTEKMVGDL